MAPGIIGYIYACTYVGLWMGLRMRIRFPLRVHTRVCFGVHMHVCVYMDSYAYGLVALCAHAC